MELYLKIGKVLACPAWASVTSTSQPGMGFPFSCLHAVNPFLHTMRGKLILPVSKRVSVGFVCCGVLRGWVGRWATGGGGGWGMGGRQGCECVCVCERMEQLPDVYRSMSWKVQASTPRCIRLGPDAWKAAFSIAASLLRGVHQHLPRVVRRM